MAIVSQGSPAVYTERLKNAGIKVVHVCSTVRHVRKAEEMGVDAVIASGTGGGHSGFDQITTLCLIPQAVDAVEIPVIAGGGIVDARGLMGALSLGAEGVYMGTRFMATKECPTHPNVKRAILEATDTSTMAIRHGSPVPLEDERRGDRGFVEETPRFIEDASQRLCDGDAGRKGRGSCSRGGFEYSGNIRREP